MPSVPTSSDTRVTSFASVDSCATIWFTVIFRSSISPCTSTFTVRERSPSATALVTSEMERTWSVRLLAIFCARKGWVASMRVTKSGNDEGKNYTRSRSS